MWLVRALCVTVTLFSSTYRLMLPPPAPQTSLSLLFSPRVREILSQEPGPPSCHPPWPLPPRRGQSRSPWAARRSETWWSWLKTVGLSPSVVSPLHTVTEVRRRHTHSTLTKICVWLRAFISAAAKRPTLLSGLGAQSKHQVNTLKLVSKVLINTILHQSHIIYFCTNYGRKEKASWC